MFTVVNEMAVAQLWRTLTFLNGALLGVTFVSAEHFLESGLIAETTCLITDLQMPGLNGLELQDALRSQGYQTAVVLITAYPNEKHRKRALDNGAVGFLSKPFSEEELIECLTAAISSFALQPQSQ
jgi:FixJ family two-component response regulator